MEKEYYIIECLVHGGTWIYTMDAHGKKTMMDFITEYVTGDAEFSIKCETATMCRERGFNV
ncbi:hypothetical protein [Paenibacillus sp. Soil724D2]|uniref:hypothetical protein n=1 Tax=Paenibacillus sp. (strain Soil724D2) TaxID=1736392 RepID=UPI000714CFED|nr:hypothetical protein [Paenibacillus sp. Soil724D2]KRE33418.1 hypothetical protein ASG85_14205 [Paenibacillus sp. Soil724D2]